MTQIFEHPEQEFIEGIRSELWDYWSYRDYSSMVISLDGNKWFIKSRPEDPEAKNRELLAFLLGGSWLNIPEVRLLSSQETEALRQKIELDENISEQNTCLVRLVQDYSKGELPVKNFDGSIASEIAFSVWIRRRDAHAANRAFAQGIPMFFDFHIAFGGEVEDFFREGSDAGYVNNWRLYQIRSNQVLRKNSFLRRLDLYKQIAQIPVFNKSHFESSLVRAAEYIRAIDQKHLFETIKKAGFPEKKCSEINILLKESLTNLDINIDRVLSIMVTETDEAEGGDVVKTGFNY